MDVQADIGNADSHLKITQPAQRENN